MKLSNLVQITNYTPLFLSVGTKQYDMAVQDKN